MKKKEKISILKSEQLDHILVIITIITALSAIIVFVFYLLLSYNKCIVFTEPNNYIRISEIIIGIIAIPVLINMLRRRVKEFYLTKEKLPPEPKEKIKIVTIERG